MNSPLFFFFFLAKTPIAPEEKGSLKLFFNHILQIGYSARSLLITLYADTAFIFFACRTNVFLLCSHAVLWKNTDCLPSDAAPIITLATSCVSLF